MIETREQKALLIEDVIKQINKELGIYYRAYDKERVKIVSEIETERIKIKQHDKYKIITKGRVSESNKKKFIEIKSDYFVELAKFDTNAKQIKSELRKGFMSKCDLFIKFKSEQNNLSSKFIRRILGKLTFE